MNLSHDSFTVAAFNYWRNKRRQFLPDSPFRAVCGARLAARIINDIKCSLTITRLKNPYPPPRYCLPILHLCPCCPLRGRLASQGPEHDCMTVLLKGMMGNKWKWQWCGSQLSLSPRLQLNKCQWMKMDRPQVWPRSSCVTHSVPLFFLSSTLTPDQHLSVSHILASWLCTLLLRLYSLTSVSVKTLRANSSGALTCEEHFNEGVWDWSF